MEVNFDFYFSSKEKKYYNYIYDKLIANNITLDKKCCFKFMRERVNIKL